MKYATLIATTAAAFAAPFYVASAQTAAGPAPVPVASVLAGER